VSDVNITTGLSGIGQVLSGFSSIKDRALESKAALAGMAAAIGVGWFASKVKESIDLADNLSKLGQKTGFTAEQLSLFKLNADLAGISVEQVGGAARLLSMRMVDAGDKTSEYSKLFDALGVALRDNRGELRNTGDVLSDTGKAIAAIPDAATRSAAAMTLFGRSGSELMPFFNSMEATTEIFKELGLVIEQDVLTNAEAFNDTWTVMGAIWDHVFMTAASVLLPTLLSISKSLLQTTTDTNLAEESFELMANTMKVLVSGGLVVKAVFEAIGKSIGGVAAAIVAAVSGDFRRAMSILNDSGTDIVASVEKTKTAIVGMWSDSSTTATDSIKETSEVALRVQKVLAEGSRDLAGKQVEDARKVAEERIKAEKQAADEAVKYRRSVVDYEIRANRMTLTDKITLVKSELALVSAGTDKEIELKNELMDINSAAAKESIDNIVGVTAATRTETLRQLSMELNKYQAMGDAGAAAAREIINAIHSITFTTEKDVEKQKSKWDQLKENFLTIGDVARGTATTFTTSFGDAFSDIVLEGKSLKDGLDDMWSNIAQAFVRMVGQMIAEWLLLKTLMATGLNTTFGIPGVAPSLAGAAAGAIGAGAPVIAGGGSLVSAGSAGAAPVYSTGGATAAGTAGAGAGAALPLLGVAAIAIGGAYMQRKNRAEGDRYRASLTPSQRAAYEYIIATGSEARGAWNKFLLSIGGKNSALMGVGIMGKMAPWGKSEARLSELYGGFVGRELDESGINKVTGPGVRPMPDIHMRDAANLEANARLMAEWSAGIRGTGAIPGYARGGDFMVHKPTLMMVGERGTERVTVDAAPSNRNRGGAGVVVQGPLILDDISMARFLRQIENAMSKRK